MRMFKSLMLSQLKATLLIRPGFTEMMRRMRDQGIDVFVFTASDTKWTQVIVPLVEQSVGVNFARPLFTRAQCKLSNGSYVKPFKSILSTMVTSMKKRRQGIMSVADLAGRVLYIDNNNVISNDTPHAPNLVLCPTYDFHPDHDVLRLVPEEVFVKKWPQIMAKLRQYDLFSAASTEHLGREGARALYYKELSSALARRRLANKQFSHDRMWSVVDGIFAKHSFRQFTPKVVDYISDKVRRSCSTTTVIH